MTIKELKKLSTGIHVLFMHYNKWPTFNISSNESHDMIKDIVMFCGITKSKSLECFILRAFESAE